MGIILGRIMKYLKDAKRASGVLALESVFSVHLGTGPLMMDIDRQDHFPYAV